MSVTKSCAPLAASSQPLAGCSVLLAAFIFSLFASAFLLFSVQPIVSRLVLPRLGGSPAVWNTCVCFFQAALLLGYGYAHFSSTRLPPRSQIGLHALVLVTALTFIPLSMGMDVPPDDAFPVIWLLTLLTLTIGLPFVAIAATAPLLQAWFAQSSHPHAKDPYFLYAASNAGSLLALLSYPLLIETTLGLSNQIKLWSIGLMVTAVAVLTCGVAVLLQGAAPTLAVTVSATSVATGVAERLRWVVLAFVPSALMLAVTTYITTEVASVPLFWVIPLMIYILTFVLAFAPRAPPARRVLLPLQGLALAVAGVTGLSGAPNTIAMAAPLAAFALTAAVCHGELASRRPAVQHLTSYFFLMSVGGALGGVFNALLAPVLFRVPLEYPLLLIAACLLRPATASQSPPGRASWAVCSDLLLLAALIMLALALFWATNPTMPEVLHQVIGVALVVVPAAALLRFVRRRLLFTLGMAICLFIPILKDASDAQVIVRTFFGVLRVMEIPNSGLVVLRHGTTVHGVQSTRPGEELTPMGYYHHGGPFGRWFSAMAVQSKPLAAVGVIGLDTGELGCYAQPGAAWTFYEIDPMVERLARDEHWFHFMAGCSNHPAVVLGDARIKLAADLDARYDLLIVDAFSSDSIPVHLITREAMALYFARLKPGGTVIFHVSSRYLNLTPVVARLAVDARAAVRHLGVPSGQDALRQSGAEIVAVSAPGGELDALAADGWDVPKPSPVLWTDERSDILGVIRWR